MELDKIKNLDLRSPHIVEFDRPFGKYNLKRHFDFAKKRAGKAEMSDLDFAIDTAKNFDSATKKTFTESLAHAIEGSGPDYQHPNPAELSREDAAAFVKLMETLAQEK